MPDPSDTFDDFDVVEAEIVPAAEVKAPPALRRGAARDISNAKVVQAIDLLHAGLDFQSVAIRTGLDVLDVKALLRYPDVRAAVESGGLASLVELRHEAVRLTQNLLEEANEAMLDQEERLNPLQKLEMRKHAHQLAKDLLIAPYQQAAAPTSVQVAIGAQTGGGGGDGPDGDENWQRRLETRMAALVQVKTG